MFRYRLVGPALEPGLSARQRGRLVRGIAGRVHTGVAGRPVQVSRKSLDRWVRAWRAGGFEALMPAPRRLEPRTDAGVLALAVALKRENPDRTAEQVRRILVAQHGSAPSARTVQRHFARLEVGGGHRGPVFGRFEALCGLPHKASYDDASVMPIHRRRPGPGPWFGRAGTT